MPGSRLGRRAIRSRRGASDQAALPDSGCKEGHLNAPKGQSISYRHVAQAIAEADHDFDIQCLAYDRYAFKRGLEPECDALGLSVEFVEHPQGGTKKGKPTEAMKAAARGKRARA
jgi:hypothetical protein